MTEFVRGRYAGPAGEIQPGQRKPHDPGQPPPPDDTVGTGTATMEPTTAPPPPPARRGAPLDDAGLLLGREEQAWRQTVVYVGTVTSDIEVGVGQPKLGGVLLRKVTFRVRTDWALDASTYWQIQVFWRDADGNPFLISEYLTNGFGVVANVTTELLHNDAGVRLEPNHEATVKFTAVGGVPTELSQVTLYADWFAGV